MSGVSIVMPVYNAERFVKEAMDSVLAQTYGDFEIIAVDDGSTDNSKSIVDKYIRKYPGRIRYIHQENSGSSVARNAGIKNAGGKYVAFFDSDDVWAPGKLKAQLGFFRENPDTDMVYSNADVIDEEGRYLRTYIREKRLIDREEGMFNTLLLKNIIPFSSVMVKRSALERTGYFDESLRASEDYDLVLRIAEKCTIGFMNDALIKYRISSNNKSSNLERRHKSTIAIALKYFEKLENPSYRFRFLLRKRFAETHYGLAYALFENQKLKEARQEFIRSITLWPFVDAKKYALLCSTFLTDGGVETLRSFKRYLFKNPAAER